MGSSANYLPPSPASTEKHLHGSYIPHLITDRAVYYMAKDVFKIWGTFKYQNSLNYFWILECLAFRKWWDGLALLVYLFCERG